MKILTVLLSTLSISGICAAGVGIGMLSKTKETKRETFDEIHNSYSQKYDDYEKACIRKGGAIINSEFNSTHAGCKSLKQENTK